MDFKINNRVHKNPSLNSIGGFFSCLTNTFRPDNLSALRRTPRIGEVEQSVTGARQTIPVTLTFT